VVRDLEPDVVQRHRAARRQGEAEREETVELDESQPEGSDATSEPPPDGLTIPPNEIPLEWKQLNPGSAWNMPAPIIAHRGATMIRVGSVPDTTPRVAFRRLPELR